MTAAELLSLAAFLDGKAAQAFPSFGSERMGAPVMAYCRIDKFPIRSREPVSQPDALLIQDSTLLHQVEVFAGLQGMRDLCGGMPVRGHRHGQGSEIEQRINARNGLR